MEKTLQHSEGDHMSQPDSSSASAARRAAALVAVLRPADPNVPVAADDVARVLREHGEPEAAGLTAMDITQMRAVAGDLLAVFAARDTAAAAVLLNQILQRAAGPPQLSGHDATPWHLHFDSPHPASWAEWLALSSAMALAVVLADRQAQPGGLCAATHCQQPFADLGRGAPRRYCSPRCASRTRVSAYRHAHGTRAV
jgi:predicted RNA-binding Zn ribbon-like protein